MMAEWLNSFKDLIKRHYKWFVPTVVVAGLLIGVVVPMVQNNRAFDRLLLEDTDRIILVRYTKEPFHSSVEWIRESKDDQANENLVERVRQGKRPFYEKGTPGRDVLFFHLISGDVLPAYVDGNRLGFLYGELWVEMEDYSDFIDAMVEVELVEVKDLQPEESTEE